MPGSGLLGRLYHFFRGSAAVGLWILHLTVADVLLSALLPLSALFPDLTYRLSSRIAGSVWRAVQLIFTRYNGAHISTSGSELPEGESAIVVCNHVSWTDFYMIQALAIRARMLGYNRWFAKQQLKWVPFLGWGLWAMGMPLISRNWMRDRRELQRVFGGIIKRQRPIWLISYSEATRFTPEKHVEAVAWCKANDKPIPRHTLHPRTRGFVTTVKELRQAAHVKAVYDVTVAYARGREFMRAPSMYDTLFVPNLSKLWRFHAHVERHPIEELPESEGGLASWLEQRWAEKGEKLEDLRNRLARGESWDRSMH